MQAICRLFDHHGQIRGIALFTEVANGVMVDVSIGMGSLTPGEHGFHIHESGDTSRGCESMGPHFDPYGNLHGGRNSSMRHVGDLGNISANSYGEVRTRFIDRIISLRGDHNIIGRGLIVHNDPDDLGETDHLLSSTTGNSGQRVLCGVISKV